MRAREIAGRVRAALAPMLTDAAGIGGAAAIVNGVQMINVAAAWIIGGLFLLVGAWLHARARGN